MAEAATGAIWFDHEAEWRTRRQRIDPRLTASGWQLVDFDPARPPSAYTRHAIREYPTANGPADYALAVDGRILGIVEAKRVALGPQNVLTQAERYSRGAVNPFDFDGLHVPFLYATNGEIVWFRDIRDKLNRSRTVAQFHTPAALAELLARDLDQDCHWLAEHPNRHPRLRPYQVEANAAVEQAIADRKRQMLVAMATGTGKTFTLVNQVYRLMKSGAARRILFLVDRRALAAQAVRAFASFEPEPGLKFDKLYEVYSQCIHRGDADEGFDPKWLDDDYLVNPKSGSAFVYVSTIQRIAINLFGRDEVFSGGDDSLDDDAQRLPIPIHAFDVIIADECHRGYTSKDLSVWRRTLDHFDAVKIGLTATPAAHTKAYFTDVVYRYEYERAVREGYLVDYDVVTMKSDVRLNGVFLKEGEQVGLVDPGSGAEQLDLLEDERQFDTSEIEQKVTAPDSNRKLLEELKAYALEHERQTGRFPKTLIFAVNDLPHTSHADSLVRLAREVFNRGDDFVAKITGRVDRPLQRIREFRNRQDPGIVVTVDMLTTGVDVQDIEFIVFLRPVKSRILFEQMLGRGTRLSERYADKSHFTVFDCFDGTLLAYFRNATAITAEPPETETRPIAAIIEDVWQNRDRDYNTRVLVKRLQRIDKQMSGDARDQFANYIPDGDVAKYAASLPRLLKEGFTATMALLRDPAFKDLLVNYQRPRRFFYVAHTVEDTVTSERLFGEGLQQLKPEDYLTAFSTWVVENADQVDAIAILQDRPRDWSTAALKELQQRLATSPFHFRVDALQKAHELRYHKALADIISMVKHAADESNPLYTAAERVDFAMQHVSARRQLTPEQQQWLDRIRDHLVVNLSIDPEDFDEIPVLSGAGGWGRASRAFPGELPILLHRLNEAIAA